MISESKTFAYHKTEQEELRKSQDARLEQLMGQSEALKTRLWTDEQLRAIPEELIRFAFEQSDKLRQEFGDLTTLLAYRGAMASGAARIAR